MAIFLDKKVMVQTCLGGVDGGSDAYSGIFTSFNDDFICLDNKIYIARKYIMMIKIK